MAKKKLGTTGTLTSTALPPHGFARVLLLDCPVGTAAAVGPCSATISTCAPSLPAEEAVRVGYGADEYSSELLVGTTVASVRRSFAGPFNIPTKAMPYIRGHQVGEDFRLQAGHSLEFLVGWGRKGALPNLSNVMTVKEAAQELNCSISLIYKLMREGQIAYERRGRRKLPVASSLMEYRQRNLVPVNPVASGAKVPLTAGYRFKHLFS